LEVWADPENRRHDFPLPEGYSDASALGCSNGAAEPEEKDLINTGELQPEESPTTPLMAWQVAQRLNLTESFTAGKAYRVMVVSYSPAVGGFDAESADWYVFLSLK
jgi:hypothetical protein